LVKIKEKICYIYKIKNIIDEKVYIGQTSNFKVRLRNHVSELKRNKHGNEYLQNAVNKFGINNFLFEILEQCNENNVDFKERYWMDFYDSCNRNKGYNLIYGGNSNKHHSKETKIKISKSLTGLKRGDMSEEQKKQISITKTGVPLSEETKAKLRIASKLHTTLSEEHKNKISKSHEKLTEIQVEEIREKYASGKYTQRKLGEEYGVSGPTIGNVIRFKSYKYLDSKNKINGDV